MEPDGQIKLAMTLEGWLGKQKPGGIMHSYNKRYCKFLDDGKTFAFSEKKEDFDKDKVKRRIPLSEVLEVVHDQKPKKFQLVCQGRVFKFEAPTMDEKIKWVRALTLCQEFSKKYDQAIKKRMSMLDTDIKFQENTVDDERKKSTGFLGSIAKTVFVDNGLKAASKVFKRNSSIIAKNPIELENLNRKYYD